MPNLINQILETKDFASAILLSMIVCVAAWIVALPLSKSVQESYLRRFHLASPNFAVWSIQQAVPSMYNFENRVWTSNSPATPEELKAAIGHSGSGEEFSFDNPKDAAELDVADIKSTPINHFPTRIFTFADQRMLIQQNPPWYCYLRSRYRDREIRSTYKISQVSDSELQVQRLEVEFD